MGERLAGLDLSEVEIAIDDRFDVWDSGIISVPYDFRVGEVEDRIRGLLNGRPRAVQGHVRQKPLLQTGLHARKVWGTPRRGSTLSMR